MERSDTDGQHRISWWAIILGTFKALCVPWTSVIAFAVAKEATGNTLSALLIACAVTVYLLAHIGVMLACGLAHRDSVGSTWFVEHLEWVYSAALAAEAATLLAAVVARLIASAVTAAVFVCLTGLVRWSLRRAQMGIAPRA